MKEEKPRAGVLTRSGGLLFWTIVWSTAIVRKCVKSVQPTLLATRGKQDIAHLTLTATFIKSPAGGPRGTTIY